MPKVPLSPADVGARVTVRHRLADGSPADAVGILERWDDGYLLVRRKDGSAARVDERAVLTARRVPERTTSVREVETIAAHGWRGLEEDRLGEWWLRSAEGWTGRANSVLPVGDPGLPLPEAVARAERWYAARGHSAMFQVPLPLAAELDALLAERGYQAPGGEVLVLTASVPAVLAATPARADLPGPTVADVPDEAWLAGYHYRGGPLPPVAPRVLVNAARPAFVTVTGPDGAALATARGAVDRGWVGVSAVEVREDARRRGLGGHVVRCVLAWAAGQGAHHAYLQVMHDNLAALGLYERMGFVRHHHYHYRRLR